MSDYTSRIRYATPLEYANSTTAVDIHERFHEAVRRANSENKTIAEIARDVGISRRSVRAYLASRMDDSAIELKRRRATVAEMLDEGERVAAIAHRLNVSRQTVYKDAEAIGRTDLVKRRPYLTGAERAARDEQIVQYATAGMSNEQIARRVGFSEKTVFRVLRRYSRNLSLTAEQVADIRRLYDSRWTMHEIAETLSLPFIVVSKHIQSARRAGTWG